MRVSFEEALSVLKKWEREETPLCALVSALGASFSLSGFIAQLDSSLILLSHLTEQAEKLGEFTIPFYADAIFGYRDRREAKEALDPRQLSSLQMSAPQIECVFYELAVPDQR